MLNRMNGYFEEINGSKFLTLVPTNEIKEIIKKYEELRIKIKYLIRSVTKKSGDYDKKNLKIKFYPDHELPLNKTVKILTILIVVGAI